MPQFEISAPINHALSRLGDSSGEYSGGVTGISSPLKRSDAIMNLDQASLGSPVAKRRSLHGSASFGHDFNVFDHAPTSAPVFDIHDDATFGQEQEHSATPFVAGNSLAVTLGALPRRSSSLRKSTLQQRHGEKQTSWGRKHAAQLELAKIAQQEASQEIATPVKTKDRPRLSLDHFLPPMPRDSPFSNQASLPNPSAHIFGPQLGHQPHPLSRTMTTSSSSSSIVDESPTHVPVFFGDQPRPRLDFSKSLPPGALRSFVFDKVAREEGGDFSTPENYKSVKPLPAAFMSTGLISKVNRFPEQSQGHNGGKAQMPDTPCKKPAHNFATYPQPAPGSAVAKARHIRHSFGTPSTPFNPHGTRQNQSAFGKGPIFGSAFGHRGLSRRSSFVSIDGDENTSPDGKGDGQSSADYDLPPTPTKQALAPGDSTGNARPYSLRNMPPSTTAVGGSAQHRMPRKSSKLNILISNYGREEEDGDLSLDPNDSPTTANFRLPSNPVTLPSFSRSRALRGSRMYSPTPIVPNSHTTSFHSPSKSKGFAKTSRVLPASPLERIDFMERFSPRTPHETMLPPDPSGLSISGCREEQPVQNGPSSGPMLPPATPTTARDYFAQIGDRRLSVTPINASFAPEIDEALTSRFENVEIIGTGEFSQVYRVAQRQIAHDVQTFFGASPESSMSNRVFAVKKSRQPYQGIRDRYRKLQEVQVLRALGQSDHVVHLIDSWEQKDHLYIQTEFCEEGSLDLFLSQVGRKGRLDDFRIWKIMLEIGQVG